MFVFDISSVCYLCLFLDQPDHSIDRKTERLKLTNDENQRLQDEVHEIRKKFEILDTRNYLLFIIIKILVFFKVQNN